MAVNSTDASDRFIKFYSQAVGDCWREVPAPGVKRIRGIEQSRMTVRDRKLWPPAFKKSWAIWMKNQDCLDDAYEALKEKISFKIVGDEFCDTSLTNDSMIWAAKSKLKSSPQYHKAFRKYLSLAGG
jgi:hypothetical protein